MANELKPCPFCGSEKVSALPADKRSQERWYPLIRCAGCFTDVPGRTDDFSLECKTAVERWNTRPAAPVDELRTVGVTYLGMFFPLSKKAKWPKTGNELVTRSQAEAIIAAERAAIPILKGTAFKSGDGWKDTTREGEICFVWNKMHPAPYAPGQYPRVGKEHWSASTENFKFEPATPDEVVILFSALETQLAAARKALEFYGDVHKYPAPLTGGMGALWSDCGAIARAALEAKP